MHMRLVGKIQSKIQTGDSKNDMIRGLQWQIDYWVFKLYNIEYVNNMIIALLELVYRVLQIIAYVQNSSSSKNN